MIGTHEAIWRIGIALTVFVVMAIWQARAPRRPVELSLRRRWPANLGIIALDILAVRVVAPMATVIVAGLAERYGLMAQIGLSLLPASLIGFVMLDLAIYAQHVVFHKVPWLWRVHRMHHTDLDLDVSTGLRFHPIEILLSLAIKFAVIIVLGIPAVAVFIFEVVLNAAAMFNHSNVSLPPRFERVMRWIFVTPEMHEVHHSIVRSDTDSNYGFNFSLWDRIFRTYRSAPTSACDDRPVTIGIAEFREPGETRLDKLLTQPFRKSSP